MNNYADRFAKWIWDLLLKLTRRKVIHHDPMESELKRVLTTGGILLFGLGQMAGGGPFVVAGAVAQMAGPAVVVSFAIAGLIAILNAACFAEFASAIPRTGSGYLFTYAYVIVVQVTMGEFMAFFVGWQLLLDQILSVSSVCSAISGAINAATSDAIKNFTIAYVGTFDKPFLAPYPDLMGVVIAFISAIVMSFGLSNSAVLSNILNAINLFAIVVCIVFGYAVGNVRNWTYRGFFPFGFRGVMSAACNCFTSYIGFEGIASAGEETFDPRKAVPRAILGALAILAVLYVVLAGALTYAMPFEVLSSQAAFPMAFIYHNLYSLMVVVSVSIALGMFGSLIGNVYSVARTGYAMASDGLLFQIFGWVSKETQGPLFGEFIFVCIAAIFTLIFDLKILVEFQNAGTLVAYTIIAGCSIIFHYQPRVRVYSDEVPGTEFYRIAEPDETKDAPRDWAIMKTFSWFFPKFSVDIALICFAIFIGLMFAVTVDVEENSLTWEAWPLIPGLIMLTGALLSFSVIFAHPLRPLTLVFQMPFPTMIPLAAIFFNIWLLVYVSSITWVRFCLWIVIGFLIYFCYGIRHSRVSHDEETLGTEAPGGMSTIAGGDHRKSISRSISRRSRAQSTAQDYNESIPLLREE